MVKIQFKNLPDTTTPVNAENLNAIQTNTENAINEVDGNIDLATKTLLSTTSGKNQEITGCAGASGKINIESGETEQDGEPTPTNPVDIISVGSNVNLFNSSNYLENYTISSGAIASGSENNNLYYIPVKYGKNYVINFEGNLSTNCIYGYCDTTPANGVSATSNVSTINNLKTLILTPPSSSNKYLLLRLNRVTQFPNMSKIKINEGTQATGYSKYGCGSVDYLVKNVNLFDKDTITPNTQIKNNVTSSNNAWLITDYIKGEPNRKIYYKFNYGAYYNFYDINYNFISGNTSDLGNNAANNIGYITYPTNAYYVRFSLREYTDYTNSDSAMFSFLPITTVNDYVEPKKQIHTIPLPAEMEFCKLGTYKDYPYKKDGKWYKHKEIGKVVLTGDNEGWSISGTGTANWFYQSGNVLISSPANTTEAVRQNDLCNRYTYAQITTGNTDTGFWILTNQIRIRYGTEDTIENFTTWLSNNNVIVYYVLANSVEEEITDKDTIYYLEHFPIYKEYTNIECINEVKPDMHIDYLYDNEVNNYWGAELDSLAEKLHNLEVGE